MRLDGKTIIITGASSGIGAAAAELFAAEGAKLVLGARREAELAHLAGKIGETGRKAKWLAGDITHPGYHKALVDLATSAFGGLDGAFNNAGTTGDMGPIPDMTTETWEMVIATNLTGGFHAARHQIPAMRLRGGGSIIFTSSFVGHTIGLPGMGAYAASKAGLIGLVQSTCCRARRARHPRQRAAARRHQDSDGRRRCGLSRLGEGAPCAQAHGGARGNRPSSAVPRLRRLVLRDRQRADGGWWKFHQQDLMRGACRFQPTGLPDQTFRTHTLVS